MQPSDALAAVTPVVEALNRLGVVYYLGGSIASSAYGVARATLDVDLIADLAQKHVNSLVELLRSAYYINRRAVEDAVARKSCFNAIHMATMFKVDVFAVKDRPYDRVALGRIRRDSLDPEAPSSEFYLVSAEDIVLAKLEWFRLGEEVSERQWLDVVGVLRVQQDSLDRAYLAKWAAELDVADLLKRAWQESGG